MPFRNVTVESSAKVSVRNGQFIVFTDREHSLAIEDISAILLENRQSAITAPSGCWS